MLCHFESSRFDHLGGEDAMRLQTPVLRALTNIASGNDINVEHLLRSGAVGALHAIVDRWLGNANTADVDAESGSAAIPQAFAREALLALSNMAAASNPALVAELLAEAPIAPLWYAVLKQRSDLRAIREAIWGLANASAQHDHAIAQQLVSCGDLRVPLFNLLVLEPVEKSAEKSASATQADLLYEIRDKTVDALHHLSMTLLAHGWLNGSHAMLLESKVLPCLPQRSRIHARCLALKDLILVHGPSTARHQVLACLEHVADEMQCMVLD